MGCEAEFRWHLTIWMHLEEKASSWAFNHISELFNELSSPPGCCLLGFFHIKVFQIFGCHGNTPGDVPQTTLRCKNPFSDPPNVVPPMAWIHKASSRCTLVRQRASYLSQSACRHARCACHWWPLTGSPPALWWLSHRKRPSRRPARGGEKTRHSEAADQGSSH